MFIPIPEARKSIWSTRSLVVDDQGSVRQCELTSKYGTLRFGHDDRDGHVGWRFKHGGGSVTLPYAQKGGRLYVGLLPEKRRNLNGLYLCAVGGFKRPTETHERAAVREAESEVVGLTVREPRLLPGLPTVMDRNYTDADPTSGEGCIRAYVVQVDAEALASVSPAEYLVHPQWPEVQFFLWHRAMLETPDSYARAAIGLLLAEMESGS